MEPMLLLLQEEAFCCAGAARPPTRSLANGEWVGMSERFMHRSGGHSTALLQAGNSCYSTPTKLGSSVQDSVGDGPTTCKFAERMFRRSIRFARA